MPDSLVRPAVSVVILSHRKRFLPAALDSVLAQTCENLSIVVQYCALNWPTKLNDAVAASNGDFIVPLCDDDLLAPTFLERCLSWAGEADLVYTDRLVFHDGTDPLTAGTVARYHSQQPAGSVSRVLLSPDAFMFGSALPMTCVIRRSLWEALRGYDPNLAHADTEFFYRAVETGARTVYIAEPLFWYRIHDAQLSKTLASLAPALRAFHAKHRQRFGITIGDRADAAGNIASTIVRPGWFPRVARWLERRRRFAAWQRGHHVRT